MSDSEHQYPKSADEILKILKDAVSEQNSETLKCIFKNISSSVKFRTSDWDYPNIWTDFYTLTLKIPSNLYFKIKDEIPKLEKIVLGMTDSFDKEFYAINLDTVKIVSISNPSNISEDEADESVKKPIWKKDYFRVFISHSSKNTHQISEYEDIMHNFINNLSYYGMDAFYSNRDIGVPENWQNVIEERLNTMDTLIAFISKNNIKSHWCDQEIGWALGRGILIIPIKLDETNPYGFINKMQAYNDGFSNKSSRLVKDIVDKLTKNKKTRDNIFKTILNKFCHSGSFNMSKDLVHYICQYDDYNLQEKQKILEACKKNHQISGSWGVVDRIKKHIEEPPKKN